MPALKVHCSCTEQFDHATMPTRSVAGLKQAETAMVTATKDLILGVLSFKEWKGMLL